MARIRSIKPDFWDDEKIGRLSRDARLLFIATWNLADDEGRLRWTAPYLRAKAFPYDDDITVADVEAMMAELSGSTPGVLQGGGFIDVYSIKGETYAVVSNMHRHQSINKPSISRLPAPPRREPAGQEDSALSIPGVLPEESHTEKEREKEKELDKDLRIDKPKRGETTRSVIDEEFQQWWQHYPLKKAKGQAERAFRTARKLADLNTLIAGAKAYALAEQQKEPGFTAYGSTWLNGKRWLDEDITPASPESLKDWLRTCWKTGNTKVIGERCDLRFQLPDIPDGVTDARAFTLQARRDWITANTDEIVAQIQQKEAS